MIVKLDKVGRVTIPSPARKLLGINKTDKVKLEIDGEKIIITKLSKEELERVNSVN